MFEPNSRYYPLETATLTTRDGRIVAYKRRRFLPRAGDIPTLLEVTANAADRLDLIAARALGDPEQFWQICDANNAMNPFDLLEPGEEIRIGVPQFEGPR